MTMFFPTNNGIVAISEGSKVVSSVCEDGSRKLISAPCKNKVVFWDWPIFRGIQYFFCGFFELQKNLRNNEKENFKKNKLQRWFGVSICVVLALLFSEIFLGLVPSEIAYMLVNNSGIAIFGKLISCSLALSFVVFLSFLLRLFSPFCELLRFNFAIEMAYSAKNLKKNSLKTSKKEMKKEQKGLRYPNFCNFVVFVSLLDLVVIILSRASFGFLLNFLFHCSIFFLCIGIGFEISYFLYNNKKMKWLVWVTQVLVVCNASRTHFETVSIAVTELEMLKKGREFMNDDSSCAFSIVYNEVRNKLSAVGINDKSDADWIVATVLGKSRGEVKLVASVTKKQYQEILKATERRANGESIDNIFGFADFFGLRFDVSKKVLTPRMETELLVELVLKAEKEYNNCTILDIGTGSGAIAVSVAKNCGAKVCAVDISKQALAVAENNAQKNGVDVEFLHSNLFEGLKRKRKFDIIVSNPPYIPSDEIANLDKHVRECDPLLALDGGKDGLDFYREIVAQAGARLNAGGQIFFEIGIGQATDVKKLLKDYGFSEIRVYKDYNKIERIVSGRIR